MCRFEDRTLCDSCSLEETKDHAYSLVTKRLLVCLRNGRNCAECDQDCAMNENRERIKNNVK